MKPARKFLEGVIDYAGLFPPASLRMDDAVHAYESYRAGPDRDLLGRFIVPAARLGELSSAMRDVSADEPWRISVTTGAEFAAGRDAAMSFNAAESFARCDALEAVASTALEVKKILEQAAEELELYIEVPVDPDPAPVISAITGPNVFAKIRTGGTTPGSIPSAEHVLRFMMACRKAAVAFKATAGLHHVVRSEYPLTYESNAQLETMFGYLNIFLASAAIDDGRSPSDVLTILEERDVSRFEFDDQGAVVNGIRLSPVTLAETRSRFARSFGSCSFTEPVSEARAIGLI